MQLPRRDYYLVEEAAHRWDIAVEEVHHAAVIGELAIHTWVQPTFAYIVTEDPKTTQAQRSPVQSLEGYVRVAPEACRVLFAHGSVARRKFPCDQNGRYFMIAEYLEKITLTINDLVILSKEVKRFEKRYGLVGTKPCKVVSVYKPITASAPPIISSPENRQFSQQNNYRFVKLDKHEFFLGDIQANIVRQLHEASQTENPWLYGKTMLAEAGSTSMIMRDVFRSQHHWKKLIRSDGRGHYRLNL